MYRHTSTTHINSNFFPDTSSVTSFSEIALHLGMFPIERELLNNTAQYAIIDNYNDSLN